MVFVIFAVEILAGDKRGTCLPSASASLLIDVRRSSGISGRSTLAFALSVSRQTLCMFEGAWTSRPFHSDEWLFSSVLLPSYEKGDLVIGRLYEAIKNVCQSPVSNAILKQRRREWREGAGMVKRPFTGALNSSLTALLHLSDNVLVVKTVFILFFLPPLSLFLLFYRTDLNRWQTGPLNPLQLLSFSQPTWDLQHNAPQTKSGDTPAVFEAWVDA